MISFRITCGNCNQKTDLPINMVSSVNRIEAETPIPKFDANGDIIEKALKQHPQVKNAGPQTEAVGVGHCPVCGNATMVNFLLGYNHLEYIKARLGRPNSFNFNHKLITLLEVYPQVKEIEIPKIWPDKVKSRFKDAVSGLEHDDFSNEMVVSQARNCLQSALRSRKAEGSDLQAEIACVAKRGQITPEMKEWAQRIRVFGNEVTHDGEASHEEATEAVDFLTLFLQVFLTLPNQIKSARKATNVDPAKSVLNIESK